MPLFASNSWRPSAINRTLRRNPAVFGVPFVLLIVGASFALQGFTQTRYDLHDQRVSAVRMFVQDRMRMTQQLYAQVTKQAELGLSKNKKKFDIREEYFRLSATEDKDWEQKRIPRPEGLPEWGVPPEGESTENDN